jgi:L-asparaginase
LHFRITAVTLLEILEEHHMANSFTRPADTGRPVIAVLTAGGTISSITDPVSGRIPALGGRELLSGLIDLADVRPVEVLTTSSFAHTPEDMESIRAAVAHQRTDPQVAGVVVTHGTDTLEETAYFLDLFHRDPRAVVVTGAIRPADDPAADGPANLRDAIAVAGASEARTRGVLVVFGGQILAAAATRKIATDEVAAFDSPDFGAIGAVANEHVDFHVPPTGVHGLPASPSALSTTRVDIVAVYPGADDTALRACAAAGAHAIVLEATGSGNTPTAFNEAVAELTAAGVVVVVSSRVHRGPIAPLYGGAGGGRELVAAGALPSGWMRPSQARIALLALLATPPHDQATARETFASWASRRPHARRN